MFNFLKSNTPKIATILSFSSAFIASTQAYAAGEHNHSHTGSYPNVYGHVDLKIHADSIVDASDSGNEVNDVYSHSHIDLGVGINENFSINSKTKLEGHSTAHDHHSGPMGDDKYFDNHELFVETLTVDFDNEHGALYAGKFNPKVGIDYHQIPGIYGYQEVEDYAILERVGAGGALKLNGGNYGQHRLDVSSFFDDTTFLSDSLINQRGHTQEKDGGISNTEDFSSYAVSLGGEKFAIPGASSLDGFYYRLGYALQAEGSNNDDDETRYTVGGGYNFGITPEVSAKIITEYAEIEHHDGEAHHTRDYSTVGMGIYYHGWNGALTYTAIDNSSDDDHHDHDGESTQVSAGYKFDNGLGIDLGYKTADVENQDRNTVGILVSYSYSF